MLAHSTAGHKMLKSLASMQTSIGLLLLLLVVICCHQQVDGQYGGGRGRGWQPPNNNINNHDDDDDIEDLDFNSFEKDNDVNFNNNNNRHQDGHCGHGSCRPITSCFNQYPSLELIHEHRCTLNVNGHRTQGVCCPNEVVSLSSDYDVPHHYGPPEWPRLKLRIRDRDIARAVDETEDHILSFLSMELQYLKLGYSQVRNTMESFHQAVFGPPDQNQQVLNLNGYRALEVSRLLKIKFKLNAVEARDGLSQFNMFDTSYERYCLPVPRCNPGQKYRTIDGSCNNLKAPLWGKSQTQYSRVLAPAYADGLSEFRLSVNGNPLPSVRTISTELTQTGSQLDTNANVMFMQFAQFFTHDLTLGSSTRAATGQGLLCCNATHLADPVFHPACKPIIIPQRDRFYSRFNHRCNNFVRNAVGPKNNCNLGYREQTNVITSYFDASMVYGNQANRSNLVRTFQDGLLRAARIGRNRREWLPYDTMNNSLACAIPPNTRIANAQPRCVFSGDIRVNQQIGLVSLQLLFMREHNRLARGLKKVNPYWSDESLFQEARRIVGAQIQHITYNEWLPIALGRSVMKANGLMLTPSGHCDGYNPKVNPSILNEFGAAAFRWHTLVHDHYNLADANGRTTKQYKMHRIFNNPSLLFHDGALDQTAYGMVAQKSEAFDANFVDDVKNRLFPSPRAQFGLDLVSLNIQRGRDHGIPPYNAIRKACGLPQIRNWRQLGQVLRPGIAQRFSRIYHHVDDIDLFVGGVNERPLPDGILGPTFSCITAEQFRRLKYGDRFWYENGGMPHSFSIEQLNEIRKVSLAGILCANGDNIRHMQPFAMLAKSQLNLNIDCRQIPQINLNLWRNERIF